MRLTPPPPTLASLHQKKLSIIATILIHVVQYHKFTSQIRLLYIYFVRLNFQGMIIYTSIRYIISCLCVRVLMKMSLII